MSKDGASPSGRRPIRTCMACRRRRRQERLVRLATVDGTIVVDALKRHTGRGAYLCDRSECASQVFGYVRRLRHALRAARTAVTVDGEILARDWRAAMISETRRTREEGDGIAG